jgi:hypothetical protein
MGFCGGGERTIVGRIALEGPRGRRPQVRMLSSAEFQNAKLVPAAGEAAGPPGAQRNNIKGLPTTALQSTSCPYRHRL